jgi:cytochrome c peroxidase
MQAMSTIVGSLRSVGAAACLVAGMAHATRTRAPMPATQLFQARLDSLIATFDTLARGVKAGRTIDAQRAFRRSRTAYKRVEGLVAYYTPEAIIALNGPLEGEDDELHPRPYNSPGAFPLVEAALFPKLADSGRATLLSRIHSMRERIVILRSLTGTLDVDQQTVFDAARAEIARVSTLDIAGFDSDRQDDALLDAAAALDGVRATLIPVAGPEAEAVTTAWRLADSALAAAASYLRRHSTFERMDRFSFIARYSVPASHAVAALRAARSVPSEPLPRHVWRAGVPSLYDSGAFDPGAYAARHNAIPNDGPAIVALGARLFTDPRLSGPGTRACAGCHLPTHAFTDGLPKRAPLLPLAAPTDDAVPARHTPTLINASLSPTLFDDERARGLEQQIADVLANPDEMRSSTDTAVGRVAADSSYRVAFAAAFGVPPEYAVTPTSLRVALANYVRSLTALDAPFDRAVRGDSLAVSAAARRGFTVFMGKARCGTCHFAPLFNGTQPPTYHASDPEIIGVPERPALRRVRLDPDPGRGAIERVETHRFAFKVPTVRNVALTAPYMHNGAYRSLDQVVAFYNAGGGTGIGIHLPYQTLFDQPLRLTRVEQDELIAFMRSLTDTTGTVPK